MELTLDHCSETCPHCGKVNVIRGFSQLMAYTCQDCGELVRLSDDPDIERFFRQACVAWRTIPGSEVWLDGSLLPSLPGPSQRVCSNRGASRRSRDR